MNALDRRHPSQRRYYRNVRNAMIAAAAAHAALLALAPMPLAPPSPARPDVLRLVETPGLLLSGVAPAASRPLAPAAGTAVTPRPLPAMAEEIREVSEPVRTMRAAEAVPPGAAAGEAIGVAEGSATAEEGPSVYYAYDTAPRAMRRVEPAYPPEARAAGHEGTVVVNVNIDERGRILRAWVAEARAADILVEAALDAAYEFAFEPGTWRGTPVTCTVAIPFQFRLKQTLELEGQ